MKTMPIHEREKQVLLSSADLEQWRAEWEKIDDDIAEAEKRVHDVHRRKQELSHLLQGAAVFSSELATWWKAQQELQIQRQEQASGDDVALTDAIVRFLKLRTPQRPASRERIRNHLPSVGYPNAKIMANPNYLYTALKRLIDRKIIKEGPAGHYSLK